jgi:hypothetical protein
MFNTNVDKAQAAVTLPMEVTRLEEIARETNFIQRRTPGFSGHGFLLSLLKAIGHGQASFGQMAVNLSQTQSKSLSRQAIHQRVDESAEKFLEKVIMELDLLGWRRVAVKLNLPFKRIVIEDATQLRMHRKNHPHFRAVANNTGPTAGAKFDVVSELFSGQILDIEVAEGHVQDRTLGPRMLEQIETGDLVLRDMGYFDVEGFATIEGKQAFWLSRLHAMAGVILQDGNSLEKLLGNTRKNVLDLKVCITAKGHHARLIAIRCPQEIADRRRARNKTKRIQNKTKTHKQSLAREGWNIYVTNLSEELFSPSQIHQLYGQRWAIEIRFRAFKNSLHMKKALNRITSESHLRVLLLAAYIFAQLTARITNELVARWCKSMVQVSIEKVAKWLVASIGGIQALDNPLPLDPRHIFLDKRRRPSLQQSLSKLHPLN